MRNIADRGNFEHCWVEGHHNWDPRTDTRYHGLEAKFNM